MILLPNLSTIRSSKPGFLIALEFKGQSLSMINDGSSVVDSIHAQEIPIAMDTP